jgi:hypothetical protein
MNCLFLVSLFVLPLNQKPLNDRPFMDDLLAGAVAGEQIGIQTAAEVYAVIYNHAGAGAWAGAVYSVEIVIDKKIARMRRSRAEIAQPFIIMDANTRIQNPFASPNPNQGYVFPLSKGTGS